MFKNRSDHSPFQSVQSFKTSIEFLLTDIDDTLTTDGQLSAEAYQAIWNLKKNQIKVIAVTGRPAGWCDLIARLWPVDAVIGENGALYYKYQNKRMKRWYFEDQEKLLNQNENLKKIESEILNQIPNAKISADQFCRLYDLAIDFNEDFSEGESRPSKEEVLKIKKIFEDHNAIAKISSIHVNGWFGNYNKVSTAKLYLNQEYHLSESEILKKCAFVGDSPNDEPLFEYFHHTFGVNNILNYKSQMKSLPFYLTENNCGEGFVEVANQLVSNLI